MCRKSISNTKISIQVSLCVTPLISLLMPRLAVVVLENASIKQADVVLLGFPLMWPMTQEVRRNDLLTYEPITREDGPAMTWSMHAVGFLELKNYTLAQEQIGRAHV